MYSDKILHWRLGVQDAAWRYSVVEPLGINAAFVLL